LYGSGIMRPVDSSVPGNPLLAYAADRAQNAVRQAAQLGADRYGGTALEYQNPLTGGPALTTIGTQLQLLHPGIRGKARRHTGSALNYIISGSGTTTVNGTSFAWHTGDFIAIPPWAWYEHDMTQSDASAMIFQVNDLPAMRALGLYRHQDTPA
jgi:gentisate 1,2-dioxygenase